MNLQLKDKAVLITGASRGIGLAMAKAFHSEGCFVIMIARTRKDLEDAAEQIRKADNEFRGQIYSFDCSDLKEWESIIPDLKRRVGTLDVVITNIGTGKRMSNTLFDDAEFDRLWKQNYVVTSSTINATLPLLSPIASLLLISSIAAFEDVGAPFEYQVAKSAIIKLTKYLAGKLAPDIRVNCIAPGNILFENGTWDIKIKQNAKAVDTYIKSQVPLKRFGKPEEIANAALFLCSNKSGFTTGTCMVIDGGQSKTI